MLTPEFFCVVAHGIISVLKLLNLLCFLSAMWAIAFLSAVAAFTLCGIRLMPVCGAQLFCRRLWLASMVCTEALEAQATIRIGI